MFTLGKIIVLTEINYIFEIGPGLHHLEIKYTLSGPYKNIHLSSFIVFYTLLINVCSKKKYIKKK